MERKGAHTEVRLWSSSSSHPIVTDEAWYCALHSMWLISASFPVLIPKLSLLVVRVVQKRPGENYHMLMHNYEVFPSHIAIGKLTTPSPTSPCACMYTAVRVNVGGRWKQWDMYRELVSQECVA